MTNSSADSAFDLYAAKSEAENLTDECGPIIGVNDNTRDASLKHTRKNAEKKLCIHQIFLSSFSSKNGFIIYNL